jgi:hypothetical protein
MPPRSIKRVRLLRKAEIRTLNPKPVPHSIHILHRIRREDMVVHSRKLPHGIQIQPVEIIRHGRRRRHHHLRLRRVREPVHLGVRRSGVLERHGGVVDAVVPAGRGRARVRVGVALAPEAGQQEGVARAEVVGADAGALEAVDGFGDHFAHAAGFFGAGDAEEAGL